MTPSSPTVDPAAVRQFSTYAEQWWNPEGGFAMLHVLQPVRLAFVQQWVPSLAGLRCLDVGCGGGLMAEDLAKAGAEVLGIDPDPEAIDAAKSHRQDYPIQYQQASIEEIPVDPKFDLITALDVIEHVRCPDTFLAQISARLKPNGRLICSTINRSKRAGLLAIFVAERVLGLVPPDSHQWHKLIKPQELTMMCQRHQMEKQAMNGIIWDLRRWRLSSDRLAVNYIACFEKQ